MSVITKRGDDGLTDMLGAGRVPKNDSRLTIYGDLDELSAAIGVAYEAVSYGDVTRGFFEAWMAITVTLVTLQVFGFHPLVCLLLAVFGGWRAWVYYQTLLRTRIVKSICVEMMQNLIRFGGDMSRVARDLSIHHAWELYTELAEGYVHRWEGELSPLRSWILPVGEFGGAQLHHARAVCRRAERSYHTWAGQTSHPDKNMGVYLNRLSDLLFTIARMRGGDYRFQP